MANDHPFQVLFETLGRLPVAHAEPVNRQAYEILYDILSVPVEKPGRCVLLRAPRAGHGKTHLLSRIQHHLGASHEFIPLHAAFGCQIDASTVIDDTLRRLLRPLPASGGLCVLDLVTRRLFASALQPLVGSGEVPCQDREGALAALRTRPIETFDFHHPNAVTAHWARENFEILGQRLAMELSQRCSLPIREVSFWVEVLFRFAATPVENPARLKALAEAVHTGSIADSVVMERLEALLGMLAQLMRVVLVADDLEGFSTDETAALRLAAFLGSLRQSVERLDVILSLNQDIWESAFIPRLSGGLADRLSEVVVELSPLTEEEMVSLLESRVPGLGSRVLAKVDRESAGTHARGLIRAAGVAWLRATAMDTQPVVAVAPAQAVPAVFAPAPVTLELSPAVQAPSAVEAAIAKATMEIPAEAPASVSPFEAAVAPVPEPVAEASVVETPPVLPPPEPAVFVPAETPPPVVETPEPIATPAPAPEVERAPAPEVERAPDPMLAIKFLAEAGQLPEPVQSWPEPGFPASTPPVEQPPVSPFQAAWNPEPPPARMEEKPAPALEPAPAEPFQPYGGPQISAFEPAIGVPSAAAAEAAPPAVSSFEAAVPAAPPVANASQTQPAFEAVENPPPQEAAETKVPDTDRVDDLLRQFRERYGRGGM